MTTVTVTDTFDLSADRVWAAISDFGGMHKYAKGMEAPGVEGEGIGMERAITMPAGTIVERLTWLDPASRSLSYTIVSGPLPFHRYVATMKVTPQGDGCSVEWEGNFEPKGVSEDEARTLAHGIYSGGLRGYKKFIPA